MIEAFSPALQPGGTGGWTAKCEPSVGLGAVHITMNLDAILGFDLEYSEGECPRLPATP